MDEHTSGSVQGISKETKWVIQGVELENSGEKFGIVDFRRYYESNGEPWIAFEGKEGSETSYLVR